MASGGASLLVGAEPAISKLERLESDEKSEDSVSAQLDAYRDFKSATDDEEGLAALADLIRLLKA